MSIINLTPHAIHVDVDGVRTVFPPSGTVARVASSVVPMYHIDDIPVTTVQFSDVENLPEPAPDTWYLVSALVCQQCHDRSDVIAPDTGSTAIRDEAGRIVAVRGFVMY